MTKRELNYLHAAKRVLNKHVPEAGAYVNEDGKCVRYTLHVDDRVLSRTLSLEKSITLCHELELKL